MRRELENYESVLLTKRYERLRAPQPWSGARRMAPLVLAMVLSAHRCRGEQGDHQYGGVVDSHARTPAGIGCACAL